MFYRQQGDEEKMNEKTGRGVWDVVHIPYSCHFVSGQGRGSDVPSVSSIQAIHFRAPPFPSQCNKQLLI